MAKLKLRETPITKLVDELGEVHEKTSVLVKREKELKDELKRYGAGSFNGLKYDATSEEVIRGSYKAELLRMYVDRDTLEKCEVKTVYLTVKVAKKSTLQLVKST